MALVDDFWTLRAEIKMAKASASLAKGSMMEDERYTPQYIANKRYVMELQNDLEEVIKDLMNQDLITIDIKQAIKGPAKLPVANVVELAQYWATSNESEKRRMLYSVGIRKKTVDCLNLSGTWVTLRLGIREKLMGLIP